MDEFVYLYRRPLHSRTAQEMQEALEKYQTWFNDLEARGRVVQYGQPLDPKAGRLVKDRDGSISDGPYAETKDIVVGFSIIRAENIDEAAALARSCPILEQGGMIEIRPVLKF